MTVLVSDSFNRANSTTTLGTTDSYNGGTINTWGTFSTAVYGIQNNKAYVVTMVNDSCFYLDSSSADVKISVNGINTGGIYFRIFSNTQWFRLVREGDTLYLQYNNGVGISALASKVITYVVGETISVITKSDGTIQVYVDGVLQITVTNTTNATVTRQGIGVTDNRAATWDNFIIEDLITGGTTTYTGSGTLQGTSTLSQPEKLIYKGSGTIQGTSNVSSVEKSILKALGTLQGSSSLTSSETYTTQTGTTYTGGGTLQGSSNVSGNEHYLYKASGTLQGISSLSSGETLIHFTGNVYSASGTVQGFSTLSASEKIIYKEISTAVGYSDSSVHEIVTLLASGIAQGYSNVFVVDKTEVIAQVSLIGKQRIEVTLIGKQKLDTIMQGKQQISINLKGVMK